MRHAATPAELALFAALDYRIAIEVDGETHASADGCVRDPERDAWLAARGWRVLRFANREVLKNLDGVLIAIAEAADHDAATSPHPGPLPQAGEGDPP